MTPTYHRYFIMTSDKRGAYPDTQETLRTYVDNIIYKVYPHSLKLIVRDFVTFFFFWWLLNAKDVKIANSSNIKKAFPGVEEKLSVALSTHTDA